MTDKEARDNLKWIQYWIVRFRPGAPEEDGLIQDSLQEMRSECFARLAEVEHRDRSLYENKVSHMRNFVLDYIRTVHRDKYHRGRHNLSQVAEGAPEIPSRRVAKDPKPSPEVTIWPLADIMREVVNRQREAERIRQEQGNQDAGEVAGEETAEDPGYTVEDISGGEAVNTRSLDLRLILDRLDAKGKAILRAYLEAGDMATAARRMKMPKTTYFRQFQRVVDQAKRFSRSSGGRD